MATVYSYVRFSSKKQEQGDSVRRQIKLGNDWLAQNPQHTLDPSLRLHDLGVSAFRGANLDEKGALGAFVALAKKPDSPIPRGAILLIERLDRFSRQQTRKAYRAFVELVEAGITVQTLDPLQTINEDNIDDLHVVLPLILQMTMAHEQSKEKSRRIGAVWEAKREKARTGEPMFRKCPSWLRWDDESKQFVVRPKATDAIEFIFRSTASGRGQRHLVTDLNKRFKPFGKSGKWNSSYIQKILNDRSVLGELQPYRFDAGGNRVKDGEPIANYYPRVVSDELFYAAAAAKESRKKAKGRNTHFVNLFVGLLHGQDGHTLQVQTSRAKGKKKSPYVQRRLVSYGHRCGLSGACSYSLNYFHLEQAVLRAIYELDDSCLESNSNDQEPVSEAESKVYAISRRMQELRGALVSTSSSASSAQEVVRGLEVLQQELQEAEARLTEVRKASETEKSKPLSKTREMILQLGKVGHVEEQALRLKLRSLISTIVESIHVRMRKKKNRRVETDLMIVLRSGERRFVVEGRHLASGGKSSFGSEMPDETSAEWWADKKALERLTEIGMGRGGDSFHLNPPWSKSK